MIGEQIEYIDLGVTIPETLTQEFAETSDESGSNFVGPTSERAIKQAEQEGLSVVFPKDNELQIDIDDAASYAVLEALLEIVDRHWGIINVVKKPSKSGKPGKRHITVCLSEPVEPGERITLQACLGSDRKRELLSLVQLLAGDPHPTLFLENKEQLLLAEKAST